MSLEKLTPEEHLLEAQFHIQEATLAHDTMHDSHHRAQVHATLSISHSLFIIAHFLATAADPDSTLVIAKSQPDTRSKQ